MTMPSEFRLYAPAPVAVAIGRTPITNANEVIRIGRNRCRAASLAESMIDSPSRRWRSTPNSTIRIAFFVSRPISMTRPIWPKTSSGMSKSHRPTIAPNIASGTVKMMTSGRIQLSYSAAMNRKTQTIDSAKMNTAWLPVLSSW